MNVRLKKLENIAECLKESVKVNDALNKDILVCAEAFKKGVFEHDLNQFWRRTLVRTTFSSIEGSCYRNKTLILRLANAKNFSLTEAEFALLKEESYTINTSGEAEVHKAKLRFKENFLFVTKISAKVCESNFVINKNSREWNAFIKLIKVRDRITHPKHFENIEISDEEMDFILEAGVWFSLTVQVNIHKMISENIQNYIQSIK